ncbi:hypothetical protein B0A55_03711 [Friedmanniomyces simplex]|uniref:NIMA interactive protein n=1 Tax=Friedmanniomyces simplex TaxID=329884 RepID=A0A4V5NH75_9PEZI|nr:hypothetical protein B0A55_03711 [Friedmanniomyces simplex]
MDHESLRTAAKYLNNLLLARGLLRNGEPVDFVKPSKDSRAQIINLVHDLILREDRGREQREHVAVTLRDLRADESRKTGEIEKLKEKCDVSARDAVQARAAERTAKEECKKVERAMKSLQDQTAKLKTSLAQVKTQCANDVRKRDLELARLKAHLQDQRRGNKTGVTAPSITISGNARSKPAFDASVHELGDPEYKLKQETTEFLTQLSQNLSDENDSLISLIRGALETMQEVLGISAHQHPDSAIGSLGSNGDTKQASTAHTNNMLLQALPTSYETLATDMDTALSHLKNILSNPNFVNVEEVEVREEEIARLREGWERMEQRWRDLLHMMDGWRRRMGTGDTINLDDLRLGMGMVSPQRGRNGEMPAEDEQSFVNGNSISEIRLPGIEEDPEAEAETSTLLEAPRFSSPMAKSSPKRKRDVLEPPAFFDLRPTSSRSAAASPRHRPVRAVEEEEDFDELAGHGEEDAGPNMTVQDKLAAAQAEAEQAATAAARTHANTKQPADDDDEPEPEPQRTPATDSATQHTATQSARSTRRYNFGLDGAGDEELDDTLGKLASPMVKKTRIRGRPKRRKSTLNPEELEELLMNAME